MLIFFYIQARYIDNILYYFREINFNSLKYLKVLYKIYI
jgi:hypothetical protein